MKSSCRLFVLALLFLAKAAFAQHQNDNWYLENHGIMNFTGGTLHIIPPTIIPDPVDNHFLCSASYSDPVTGNLLLYTDGGEVYNSQNQIMLNGDSINGSTGSGNALIVPYPHHSNLFYVFTISYDTLNKKNFMTYSLVDLDANNGSGAVVKKNQVLISKSINYVFTVVSQLYDQGWWLITHQLNTDVFCCFRINETGIDSTPVLSNAGPVSSFPYSNWNCMVSTSDGGSFFYSEQEGRNNTSNQVNAGIYNFDKRCGSVSLKSKFSNNFTTDTATSISAAFSSNDKILYLSWHVFHDFPSTATLVQYDLSITDPNSSVFIVQKTIDELENMQLAPDGKIYLTGMPKDYETSKISVIDNPDILGAGCNFRFQAYDVGQPGAIDPSDYAIFNFPSIITDFTPKKGSRFPKIVKKDPCILNNTLFYAEDGLMADSIVWDLGDGSTSRDYNVAHDYTDTGTYLITLRWYACDRVYEIKDSITISPKVILNLSGDTTICKGVSHRFYANDSLDEYRWSTGDSTDQITVTSPDMYTLEARRGLCWVKDSAELKNFQDILTTLDDEYYICDDSKDMVKLDAGEGFQNYLWNPTGDTTQWIEVMNVGDYFVMVKDFHGCGGSDGTKVKRRCPSKVYYPNAFTPNGDGLNDDYKPSGDNILSFSMKIYNRWGGQVFETHDLNTWWDGKVKGVPAPADMYFYTSSYSGYFNKHISQFESTGSLSLIR